MEPSETARQNDTHHADDAAATARRLLPLIDLTSLGENDEPATIDKLCDAATTPYGTVAAICIWPRFVEQAVRKLTDTNIPVAAVANFPEGDPDLGRAATESTQIVSAGGAEVDVVFPWRALADGNETIGGQLVAETRRAIGTDALLKVILETGELQDPGLIRAAAESALDAGADFLKTSTGKTERSASPEAARTMLDVIAERGGTAGLKISGGVRTVDQAAQYLKIVDDVMGPAWATPATVRFGASALLDDVLRNLEE